MRTCSKWVKSVVILHYIIPPQLYKESSLKTTEAYECISFWNGHIKPFVLHTHVCVNPLLKLAFLYPRLFESTRLTEGPNLAGYEIAKQSQSTREIIDNCSVSKILKGVMPDVTNGFQRCLRTCPSDRKMFHHGKTKSNISILKWLAMKRLISGWLSEDSFSLKIHRAATSTQWQCWFHVPAFFSDAHIDSLGSFVKYSAN